MDKKDTIERLSLRLKNEPISEFSTCEEIYLSLAERHCLWQFVIYSWFSSHRFVYHVSNRLVSHSRRHPERWYRSPRTTSDSRRLIVCLEVLVCYLEIGFGYFAFDREFRQEESFVSVNRKVCTRTSIGISQGRGLIFASWLISIDTWMGAELRFTNGAIARRDIVGYAEGWGWR